MIQLAPCFPYLISFLSGYFLIQIIFNKKTSLSFIVHFILSQALGLGISAQITFLSFILFDRFIAVFVIMANLLCLILLFYFSFLYKENRLKSFSPCKPRLEDIIPIFLIIIMMIPLWLQAHFFAHGGWDAWSVWNIKAKFLFLGGHRWDNMFDPILWRSSPHYPLLLPLINVWGWSFINAPVYYVPLFTSIIFTFLVMCLLYFGLKELLQSQVSFVAVVVLLTSPLFVKHALSQYCDLIFGFYLLASIYCLVKSRIENCSSFSLLAGLFIGLLTFTKGEGLLAAGLLTLLSFLYLSWNNKHKKNSNIITCLVLGIFFAALPTIIFKVFFAPSNVTFTNGLISQASPSSLMRLKAILIFYFYELKSLKWNGLLIIMASGLLLLRTKAFDTNIIIIPIFIIFYSLIVTCYYFINTQFEIFWWLKSTLERIIFALLPTIVFWIFFALFRNKNNPKI